LPSQPDDPAPPQGWNANCSFIFIGRGLPLKAKGALMKRTLAALIVAALIPTLAACGTLTGAAVGAGVGATQDRTAEGAAIGAGVGAIYDLTH
jgi:hypothetical protein